MIILKPPLLDMDDFSVSIFQNQELLIPYTEYLLQLTVFILTLF